MMIVNAYYMEKRSSTAFLPKLVISTRFRQVWLVPEVYSLLRLRIVKHTCVCSDKPHYTLYHFHMWTSKVGNDWLSDKKTQDFSLFIWRKNTFRTKKIFQYW